MNVRIKFLGGAGSVTGSKFLLEIDDFKLLIDCGLFQGKKELRLRNREAFPLPPNQINAVLLTHGHLDHSGYLPKFVKEGFKGPIYCTSATADLLHLLLRDSAKLQEEEALFAFKKGYSKHDVPEPLYTQVDAERVFGLLRSQAYTKSIEITSNIVATFYPAGHILGAASIKLTIKGENQTKTLVFSGDIGNLDDPLLPPPHFFDHADVVIIESTYGGKIIENNHEEQLAECINNAFNRGGTLIIPAFSIGRTQALLYYIQKIRQQNKIPHLDVYLDSPMAINATDIYQKHSYRNSLSYGTVFNDPMYHYCRKKEASCELNTKSSGTIIISASGMCTGGRILHHLFHRLPKKEDTVLFVGYQAEATRGDRILRGEKSIKIFGEEVPVNCHIEKIEGFSAHGDQAVLMEWLAHLKENPKFTFIVHGEGEQSVLLQKKMEEQLSRKSIIPYYLESFELFRGI